MRGLGMFRTAAGFALLLVLLGSGLSHASAGGTASITIHNRLCPTGYTGNQLFADCHGNPQDSNLDFTIDGPVTETFGTGDDGNVAFQLLAAGTYNISGGVPGEFATTVVFCSVDEDPDTLFEATETSTGVSVDLEDGTDVICDWYNTPIDLSGGPTPTPTPSGGVTQLPNTGGGESADATPVRLCTASWCLNFEIERRTQDYEAEEETAKVADKL
jgi:hypothetical protein